MYKKLQLVLLALVGLFQGQMIADVQINEPDGASVQIDSDGTKHIKSADGTTIDIKPDGSKKIHKPDGTTIDVTPPSR